MMQPREKAIHWAEAFGLSALVHVGAAYLLLNTVVDLGAVFTPKPDEIERLEITSLAIETGTSDVPGSGQATLGPLETLAPVTPADTTLDPITPVSPAPEGAQPNTPTPAEPVTERPTPERVAPVETAIAQSPISALRPETQTLAPVGAAPIAPAAPAQPAPEAAPILAEPDTTAASAPPPQPPAASSGAEPDPVAADLIARIRDALGETCLIAIPQQSADGGIGLTIYTANEAAAAPFADDILAGLTPRPDQQTVLIDPRQCAALDYIRQSAAYPTSPMRLSLDATRIASGTDLTGRLAGTGGRNITLLLVDDNGVTQDLSQYLSVAVNTARFAAPLRRAGAPRDTQQLLLAIGTPVRPTTASAQNGQEADDYFAALAVELGGSAPIALVPFDVQ